MFSHGSLMDRTMFNAQIEVLSEGYRCVAWDKRGFGDTPLDGPFTYWDTAEDVIWLMDLLGVVNDETLAGYAVMIQHRLSDVPLGEVGTMVAGLIIGQPDLMEKWIGIWESRDRSTVKHPGDCLLGRDDISGRTDEIIRPVLVVHGEEDLAIPIETARQLCDDLSDCRGMVPVPGAAHASNMTHPEVVTPAIAEFLAVLD